MSKKKKKQKKKKVRIKYKNIFLFLVLAFMLLYFIYILFKLPIQGIYIKGNYYVSEKQIIKEANLTDYPSLIETLSFFIEPQIEKNKMIKSVKISHKKVFELHIDVKENRPLYYDETKKKTVLEDGYEVKEKYNVPLLLNYIPDHKYKKYISKLKEVNIGINEKISEIKYSPNDKDDERFLLSMSDGNYVYLTLSRFEQINHYLEIMTKISKKFNNQKGILYLDSGGYFKVFE